MSLAPIHTRFFTFYSFKGGVGRSMALYNCACLLAGSGRRILMIDFDLEAPGLTYLLYPEIKKSQAKKKRRKSAPPDRGGMLELVSEYLENPREWPLGNPETPERIKEYCPGLEIPEAALGPCGPGCLALLPAGKIDDDYEKRLTGIQWNVEPLSKFRDSLFHHLREVIIRSKCFDYVFIDARTGLSDEGYISARLLADDLVVFSALNNQNVLGTSRFLKKVDAWNRTEKERRRVILVASPVPVGEEAAKRERLQKVAGLLKKELGQAAGFSHTLSYNARLALYEELIVAHWPESTLAGEYRDLAKSIRELADDNVEYWLQQVNLLVGRLGAEVEKTSVVSPSGAILSALESLRSVSEKAFEQTCVGVAQIISRSGIAYGPGTELLQQLSQWHSDDPLYALEHARLIEREAEPRHDEARQQLEEARSRAQRAKNRPALYAVEMELGQLFEKLDAPDKVKKAYLSARKQSRALKNIGDEIEVEIRLAELAASQGKTTAADGHYKKALDLGEKHGEQEGVINGRLAYGRHLLTTGRVATARDCFGKALGIARELNNRQGVAVTLHELAKIDLLQGNYSKARSGYEQALEIMESLGDRQGVAVTLHELAKIDLLQGDYTKARAGYEQALEIMESLGYRRGIATTLYSMADIDRCQGDYSKARSGYEQALEIMESLGDRQGISATLHYMAHIDRLQGDYSKARSGYEQALQIHKSLGYHREIAVTVMYMASLRLVMEPKRKPLELEKSIQSLEQISDPHPVVRGYLLLADAYVERADLPKALETVNKAIDMAVEKGFRDLEAQGRATRALLHEGTPSQEAAEDAAMALSYFEEQKVRYSRREELTRLLS